MNVHSERLDATSVLRWAGEFPLRFVIIPMTAARTATHTVPDNKPSKTETGAADGVVDRLGKEKLEG